MYGKPDLQQPFIRRRSTAVAEETTMSFHLNYRAEYLQRPFPAPTASSLDSAATLGVQLQTATVTTGAPCWRVIGVHHLTPTENRGKHVVYVDVVDAGGNRVRDPNLRLLWGWVGQRGDEYANPRAFDKPDSEPATNVELYPGQLLWVRVEGDGLPSDTVANLHANHPEERGADGSVGNGPGRHSYYILFQQRPHTGDDITDGNAATDGGNPDGEERSTGNGTPFRFAAWPTETRVITQPFGVNAADYSPFGLAGHEGIDIAAATGSRIFAVASGVVKLVKTTPEGHNYGIHVRIQHGPEYETIYAHLESASVTEGQTVAAGQVIGLADSTGNARGNHLHLSLKRRGANLPGYPGDFIDPLPFLQPLLGIEETLQDSAIYVSDQIADGTRFKAGTQIEQQWTVRNSGTTTWGAGYELAFESGVQLGDRSTIAASATAPGVEATFSLTFAAPTAPGNYRSNWRLRNAAGQWFGQRLWVDITVIAESIQPPVVRGNKLGFYLHMSTDQFGMWEAVRRVQPPVILIHADTANDMLLNEIRAFRAPDALVIGRYYLPNDEQRALLESRDPAAEGHRFAERILTHDFGKFTKRAPSGRLLIDGWMSLNECLPGPASGSYQEDPAKFQRLYAAYDVFQAAFHDRLQEAGIAAVAFNFAAGNFTEAAHYLDFFPQTLVGHTYLGFHEYGWPALMPEPGGHSSAGLYRSILAGIRAIYGQRHQVVMTGPVSPEPTAIPKIPTRAGSMPRSHWMHSAIGRRWPGITINSIRMSTWPAPASVKSATTAIGRPSVIWARTTKDNPCLWSIG
ncbi:MAG: NBR1-Ig-like domain-containing protein [Caldilineaceae bacterium]